MSKTNKIGVTEGRPDPGLDYRWAANLKSVDMAIVITKQIANPELQQIILNHKDMLVIHATCTGYGGTVVEAGVPPLWKTCAAVDSLLSNGIRSEQIVLRLDPIIPTPKGIARAEATLIAFAQFGITRCRFSVLDMYDHVIERFRTEQLTPPFTTFKAPPEMMAQVTALLNRWKGTYRFESCTEVGIGEQIGCVSYRDVDALGMDIKLEGTSGQRTNCLCPKNKVELVRPVRVGSKAIFPECDSKCLYCYWKT